MRLWGWSVTVLALAGLASWGGGQLVVQGARAGLAELAVSGQGSAEAVQAMGFPLAVGAQIKGLRLTDPALGALEFAAVQASAPLWSPLDWRAVPDLPAQVTLAGQSFTLEADAAEGGLRLGLGADLPLANAALSLTAAALTAKGATAPVLAVQSLSLAASGAGARYAVEAGAQALTLPPQVSTALALPNTVETFTASGTLSFAAPVALVTAALPQLTEIDLTQAHLLWGGHGVSASGKLTISAQGGPEGTILLATKDWSAWLEVAQAAGLIERERMPMLMSLGAYMAGQSGTGEVQLPLTFAKGMMSLGPLPLGPAPRFAL